MGGEPGGAGPAAYRGDHGQISVLSQHTGSFQLENPVFCKLPLLFILILI